MKIRFNIRFLAAAALLGIAGSASATESLVCAEDFNTNALFCFARSQVRDSDGIRSAPLYTGGPKSMSRSNFTVNVNCAGGVMALKDRQGVTFAGASADTGTQQSRDLLRYLCVSETSADKAKAAKAARSKS